MGKTKKVFTALLLAILMTFGVAGCSSGTNDLQSQLDEISNRLTEMDKKIEQLEKELAELSMGTFYTLQVAYDNGWLTQADLMSIAYYHNGGRMHNEELMSEDYAPAPKTPEVLSNATELKIKGASAKKYREKYDIKNAEADGFTITEYCGTYGGCVAIMMRDDYSGAAGVAWTDNVANVDIYYNDGNEILIWRDTK